MTQLLLDLGSDISTLAYESTTDLDGAPVVKIPSIYVLRTT
jgi:hypothetical protein